MRGAISENWALGALGGEEAAESRELSNNGWDVLGTKRRTIILTTYHVSYSLKFRV